VLHGFYKAKSNAGPFFITNIYKITWTICANSSKFRCMEFMAKGSPIFQLFFTPIWWM